MSSRIDQDIAVTDGSESEKVVREVTQRISSMPPKSNDAPNGNGNGDDCDDDNDDSFWSNHAITIPDGDDDASSPPIARVRIRVRIRDRDRCTYILAALIIGLVLFVLVFVFGGIACGEEGCGTCTDCSTQISF